MTSDIDARMVLVDAALQLVAMKLNSGTVGNISMRHGAGMLVTPTGIAPSELRPDQIVEMDFEGRWEGQWRPSSEWAIHAAVYRASSNVGAVIHAHPDHCVALASLRQPIPAFHYMVAGFGGNFVPCAEYACFGSPALAETVVEALGETFNACLMANHGVVVTGRDLATALSRADKLETLARQYLLARAAGEPVLLTDAELVEVRQRYARYGQQLVT